MSDHTPGPWKAIIHETHDYFPSVQLGPTLPYEDGSGESVQEIIVNCGPTPEMVAAGEGSGSTTETTEANARLIAAAPDLLEACKAMLHRFGHLDTDAGKREATGEARAAIAKATPDPGTS